MTKANAQGLDEALNEAKWSKYHTYILFLVAFAFFGEGLDVQVLGLALPDLAKDWHMTPKAFAPAASIGLLGFAIGASIAGRIGDKIGRRITLVGSVLLFGIATALSAYSNNLLVLSLFRIIAGLGLGGAIPNGTSLISEYMPKRAKALALGVCMISVAFGGMVSGILASKIIPSLGWSNWFMISGVLGIIAGVVLLVGLPESPLILAKNQAQKPQFDKIMAKLGLPNDFANIEAPSPQAEKGVNLFQDKILRQDLLILSLSSFFLYLGWYSIFTWGSVVLTAAGLDLAIASKIMASAALGSMIGAGLSGVLVRFSGSKNAFIVLTIILALAVLYILQIYGQPDKKALSFVIGFIALGAGFAGFQTVLYAMGGHLFPTEVKATGIGVSISAGRIGAILSAFTGIMAFNMGGGFGFFGVLGAAVAVALLLIVIIKNQIPPISKGS